MSFLNQLKSQASALQQQHGKVQNFEANMAQTEMACQKAWVYLSDLARHKADQFQGRFPQKEIARQGSI